MPLASHHRHHVLFTTSCLVALLGAGVVGLWQFRMSAGVWRAEASRRAAQPKPVQKLFTSAREQVASSAQTVKESQAAALELLSNAMERDLAKQRLVQDIREQLEQQ